MALGEVGFSSSWSGLVSPCSGCGDNFPLQLLSNLRFRSTTAGLLFYLPGGLVAFLHFIEKTPRGVRSCCHFQGQPSVVI